MKIRNADLYIAAGGSPDQARELDALGADLAGAAIFRIRGGNYDQAVALARSGVNLWDAHPGSHEGGAPPQSDHLLAG